MMQPSQPYLPQQQRGWAPLQHAGAAYYQPQPNLVHNAAQPTLVQPQLQQNKVPTNQILANNSRMPSNSLTSTTRGTSQHTVMKPSGGSSARNQALANAIRGASDVKTAHTPPKNSLAIAKGPSGSKTRNDQTLRANKGPAGPSMKTVNGKAKTTVMPRPTGPTLAGSPGTTKGGPKTVASNSSGTKASGGPGNGKPSQTKNKPNGKGKQPGNGNDDFVSAGLALGGLLDGLDLSGVLGGGDGSDNGGDTSSTPVAGSKSGSTIVSSGQQVAEEVVDSSTNPVASNSDAAPAVPADTQDACQTGADQTVSPTVTTTAFVDQPAAPNSDGQDSRLVLVNPKDSPGPVNYAIDGNACTIDVGTVQGARGTGPWLVEFDRGVGGDQARYSLTEASYTFTLTEKGWELYNTTAASLTTTNSASVDPPVTATSSAAVDPPATTTQDSQDSKRLVLINPNDSAGSVNYMLDGNAYTLEPGKSQDLTIYARCLVEFDRGIGDAGARYTLADGSYSFTVTDKGWELYNTTYDVTLDNTANGGAFYYVRGGREESVPAGGTRKITDKFAIEVSFDRGDGGNAAQRTLDQNGATYRIALSKDSNTLDLIVSSSE